MPAELKALQIIFLGRFQELGQEAGLIESVSVENVDCGQEWLGSQINVLL